MAEVMTNPMPFVQAEVYLARLIANSGAFRGGSRPVIGRLKKSYGYGKVIGIKSFDNSVYTRIDYDPDKGYHFNFINDNTGQKICILISDIDEYQYRAYIDRLTNGRGTIDPTKRPIMSSIMPEDFENDDLLISYYESLYEYDSFDDIVEYYESLLEDEVKHSL